MWFIVYHAMRKKGSAGEQKGIFAPVNRVPLAVFMPADLRHTAVGGVSGTTGTRFIPIAASDTVQRTVVFGARTRTRTVAICSGNAFGRCARADGAVSKFWHG